MSVWSHGGSVYTDDHCSFDVGHFEMRMSTYLIDEIDRQQYCEKIPSTGRVVIAFDFIDAGLRQTEVEFRLIAEAESGTDAETGKTVLRVPFNQYPSGTFYIEEDFFEENSYFAELTVKKGDHVHEAQIPIAIGVRDWSILIRFTGIGTLILLMAYAFYAHKKFIYREHRLTYTEKKQG